MNWIKLSSETVLWLTLDIILLTILIILASKFYRRLKSTRRISERPIPKLKLCSVFEDKLRLYGSKRALTETFPLLLEALALMVDINISKSLTSKEILSKLRGFMEKNNVLLLEKMYALYEPVRFWNHQLTGYDLEVFRNGLIILERSFLKSGAQNP
ncbi:MAG: hypothetical protein QXN62_01105 [Candidatus Bathyarchaeia archaeon]|nr:hypothetical protein [Candidatus Bathyarchaeota archaeon]